MMLIEVETHEGPRKVRVCDYCKCVCIPSGRFCSGHCSRNYEEFFCKERGHEPEEPHA